MPLRVAVQTDEQLAVDIDDGVVAGRRRAELTMRVRPISSMPRDLASTR
jgi:hypothetical protein